MKRKVSVFIASPGDLSKERNHLKKIIHQLNVGFGDGANVEFEALGWEATLASTGRRIQAVINQEIDKCDVFILAMYRRWGQEAPDAKPYSSYTEEEFHRALERWKKDGKPEIFVFFKRVDAESEADPGIQLKKVMDFRKQLEETRQVRYHYFYDLQSFSDEVYKHLRAYAKDELPRADMQKDIVILPSDVLEQLEKAKVETQTRKDEAEYARDAEREALLKIESMQIQMAEDAAILSQEGKVEFARQKFTGLLVEATNLQVLFLAYEFFSRTGDLKSAQAAMEKWLLLCDPGESSLDKGIAYGNLGILYQIRGELDRAEEMYLKSLAVSEALGHNEGMASQYGNLGNLYQTRGEFDRAEEMLLKSLAINEALGRKEGMANQYGNLGNLYKTRGELDRAEEMCLKSLAIYEALGRKEGMANQYGNLGNLYQTRGELGRAEEMCLKSLAFNEALGRNEGMAIDYGNLGNLYQTRGEFDRAEEMYLKSLAIDEALGRKEGIANQYGNLGNLYQIRGEFDRAEEMCLKSLAIDEALGRKEGMANGYGNLGILYQIRGELDRAEEMCLKSLAIDEALGRKEGMANQYGNLGILYQSRGELERAEEMYRKSLLLFKQLKSPLVEKITSLLNELNTGDSDKS